MILSNSPEYSSKALQPQLTQQYNNRQKQQLLEWATLLPTHTEAEQTDQLKKILTELVAANSEDNLYPKLVSIVITAAERVITNLRQHYIYETDAFTDIQLSDAAQVKSIYYLIIAVYDRIVRQEAYFLDGHYAERKESLNPNWKHYFTRPKLPKFTLAAAIYQSLLSYQKLFFEQAISYQKPPASLWSAVNYLYNISCQYHIVHTDLSPYVVTRHAYNIHRLYCELCLHSLLNVRAMPRHNILLAQRLLPEWAEHMVATTEPKTKTHVFVDLLSDKPPTYLTCHSKINPYNEQHTCLFIELAPLVAHLKLREQILASSASSTIERSLMNKIWLAISYRYIEPQLTAPTAYSPRQAATMVTDFNSIHYHVAGEKSLMSLIAIADLPPEQQPLYDTTPKQEMNSHVSIVHSFDNREGISPFRRLQLLPMAHEVELGDDTKGKSLVRSAEIIADTEEIDEYLTASAPPLLRLMSLFLLRHPTRTGSDKGVDITKDNISQPNWSIGVVRWLNLDSQENDSYDSDDKSTGKKSTASQSLEAEWQLMGHEITACAVRLYSSETRSQRFVPALLISGDEQLQTASSLLLPGYNFQTNDKVMIRMNDKQHPLRLQRSLYSTESFSQYEIVRL